MYTHLFCKLNFICLTLFSISLIFLSPFLDSLVNLCSGIASSIVTFWILGFKISKASALFFLCSTIVFICFSNDLPSGEYIKAAYSIILL